MKHAGNYIRNGIWKVDTWEAVPDETLRPYMEGRRSIQLTI